MLGGPKTACKVLGGLELMILAQDQGLELKSEIRFAYQLYLAWG